MVRCYLHILVALDILESLFETEYHRRYDTGLVVGTRRAHIGELFALGHIHGYVVVLGVLAHYLACVHLFLREDEKAAAVLQFVDRHTKYRSLSQ